MSKNAIQRGNIPQITNDKEIRKLIKQKSDEALKRIDNILYEYHDFCDDYIRQNYNVLSQDVLDLISIIIDNIKPCANASLKERKHTFRIIEEIVISLYV